MHARSRLAAVVAAMLVAFAFLAAVPPARASMSRPTWTTGDYWVYSFGGNFGNGSTRFNGSGTLRFDVVGVEAHAVNGTSYSTYHTTVTLSIRYGSVSLSINADVWYSVDTLAVVEISAAVSLPPIASVSISGNPPQTIEWPLTAGAHWSSSTAVTSKEKLTNGTTIPTYSTLSTNFDVLADTTITVPAGTFTTTPLKETATGVSSGYAVVYWSPQAGNSARTESYNNTGADKGGYNLTAYNYQGGSFLTSIYLGLSGLVWLIIIAVVIIVIAAVVIMRRRRPRAPMQMPPQQPMMQQTYEPPPGPPGSGP
jgi:hypothetical protein